MKFIVQRTSKNIPPCEESVIESFVVHESLDHSKFEHFAWEYWIREGKNHVKYDNMWYRDVTETAWFVELSDLDALVKFCAAYGEVLVVSNDSIHGSSFPRIEIYDDCRE